MISHAQVILQSARIAELRASASSVAALCKPPPAVELPRAPRGDDHGRRRLLLLLAHERRRSARLVAELVK
jgi:hypothetical protein